MRMANSDRDKGSFEDRALAQMNPEQRAEVLAKREVCLWDSWVFERFRGVSRDVIADACELADRERARRLSEGLLLFGNTYVYRDLIKGWGGSWDPKLKGYLLPNFEVVQFVRTASRLRNPKSILKSARHASGNLGWSLTDKARYSASDIWDMPEYWDTPEGNE